MISNYMETLENCRFCLMCRHVAPVGLVTDKETYTPHGIALIATSQARGLVEWNEETVGVIFSGPDGGNSRAHCVFDQPHPEAVAAVRANLVQQNLAPAVVYELDGKLLVHQTPFSSESPLAAEGSGDVALFVGDEARYLWPETLPAVLKLLQAVNIDPVLVGNGRNSGFLAASIGLEGTARTLIQTTLDELAEVGAQRLLLLSPGDYFAFNQAFAERLDMPLNEKIERVELVSVLAEALAAGRLQFRQADDLPAAFYVDPTHAVRHAERHEAVRSLVSAALEEKPGELFFNRQRAHPTGSTHLQFSNPELARQLTVARLRDAWERGAKTLICDDPGTLYQLQAFAEPYDLRVLSLYELLADHVLLSS